MTYTKVPSAISASPASPNNVPSAPTTAPAAANYSPVPSGIVTLSQILASAGARMHFWFEVGVSAETLNGSNFSQLNDAGPAGYHAVQATAGNQPSKVAGGGPNSKDCITYQSTGRRLTNTSIGLSTNRALTFFSIDKAAAAATSVQCGVRTGGEAAGNFVYCSISTAANHQAICTVNGGTEDTDTVTTPAVSSSWKKRVQRYAASLAVTHQINGVAVSPAFAAGSVGKASNVDTIVLGNTLAAGGSLYMLACIEDCTATEEAMVLSYLFTQTGL